jgi:hypothetical protein
MKIELTINLLLKILVLCHKSLAYPLEVVEGIARNGVPDVDHKVTPLATNGIEPE